MEKYLKDLLNEILIIFFGKIKNGNIEEAEFEENIIYEKEQFIMPELIDIFGNKENIFSGYEANIPRLKVRQFSNFYCFSNREEIYNSKKE